MRDEMTLRRELENRLSNLIADYVEGYEFEGDGGSYAPSKKERGLILDAIHGALSESDIADALRVTRFPQLPRWVATDQALPECGVAVLGYNPAWVDEDFNESGIRECFTYGDGTEWHTAKWVDGEDYYLTTDGEVPTHWTPQPCFVHPESWAAKEAAHD